MHHFPTLKRYMKVYCVRTTMPLAIAIFVTDNPNIAGLYPDIIIAVFKAHSPEIPSAHRLKRIDLCIVFFIKNIQCNHWIFSVNFQPQLTVKTGDCLCVGRSELARRRLLFSVGRGVYLCMSCPLCYWQKDASKSSMLPQKTLRSMFFSGPE